MDPSGASSRLNWERLLCVFPLAITKGGMALTSALTQATTVMSSLLLHCTYTPWYGLCSFPSKDTGGIMFQLHARFIHIKDL